MKNELSKRKPRNALAVGYVGPQGFTEGARAHMRAPTMDDVRKGAEIADMSFLPGISDAAAGVLAVDEARKGNWGAAGLNALGVLPFVPALGGIFIGKGAKTFDALKAAEAQKLLDSGADPRQVWQQTGTFKGADGALRQEIDDSAATLNAGALRDFHTESALVRQGRLMNHPDLSAAYPDVAGVAYRKQAKTGAAYEPDTDTIYLAQGAGDPRMAPESRDALTKSPALHELQHAIQQREGWARGGNAAEMADRMPSEQAINDAKVLRARVDRGESLGEARAWFLNTLGRDAVPEASALAEEMGTRALHEMPATPDEAYRRLAGEAEARAVQKRMNYTPEQRTAVYPFDDYDVPVNSLIVRTNR